MSSRSGHPGWPQRKYREVFDQTCAELDLRRRSDPQFTVDALRGLLATAYVNEGNDWIGRGAVHDLTQAAIIAAFEHTLAEWQAEPAPDPPPRAPRAEP